MSRRADKEYGGMQYVLHPAYLRHQDLSVLLGESEIGEGKVAYDTHMKTLEKAVERAEKRMESLEQDLHQMVRARQRQSDESSKATAITIEFEFKYIIG